MQILTFSWRYSMNTVCWMAWAISTIASRIWNHGWSCSVTWLVPFSAPLMMLKQLYCRKKANVNLQNTCADFPKRIHSVFFISNWLLNWGWSCLFFPKNQAENCLTVAYFSQKYGLKVAYKDSNCENWAAFKVLNQILLIINRFSTLKNLKRTNNDVSRG